MDSGNVTGKRYGTEDTRFLILGHGVALADGLPKDF
jgi:hypothetical protein